MADVGLRGPSTAGLQSAALGEAAGIHAHELLLDAEERLYGLLGLRVGLLAEVVEADAPVAVDGVYTAGQ